MLYSISRFLLLSLWMKAYDMTIKKKILQPYLHIVPFVSRNMEMCIKIVSLSTAIKAFHPPVLTARAFCQSLIWVFILSCYCFPVLIRPRYALQFPVHPLPGTPNYLSIGSVVPGHQLESPLCFIDELTQSGDALLHWDMGNRRLKPFFPLWALFRSSYIETNRGIQ